MRYLSRIADYLRYIMGEKKRFICICLMGQVNILFFLLDMLLLKILLSMITLNFMVTEARLHENIYNLCDDEIGSHIFMCSF